MMQVRFTKFTRTDGDKLLCKKVSLQEDGGIEKQASANMLSGKFETIELDFHSEFGEFLKSLELSEALGMGHCKQSKTGQIVTRSSNLENLRANKVCRTKDNFIWNSEYNLVFFDIDKNTSDIDEIMADIFSACPELIDGHFWAYPSAGSCIYTDGEDSDKVEHLNKAISGWHIYFLISGDPIAFQQWVEVRMWNAGKGWIEVSKSGAMLKRCLVDLAVFSPERLDFIAGAYCTEGLSQDRGDPVYIGGGGKATPIQENWEVSSQEYNEFVSRVSQAKQGKEYDALDKKKEYAGTLIAEGKATDIHSALALIDSANDAGTLLGTWQVQLDDDRVVSVATILDHPADYDGLTCADPLEPSYGGGHCKAKIFWNVNSVSHEVRITSFAHGGRQWILKYDYKSICDWIARPTTTNEEAISSWKYKMTRDKGVLTTEERSDILKKLKAKLGGGINVPALRETLANAENEASMKEVSEQISELNKDYAVLPIGNKVRILREFMSKIGENEKRDFTILTRQDFTLLLQNKLVQIGDKPKPLADVWLASDKRREFKGIEFNPAVVGNYDGYYNPFRGLAVEPVQGDWSKMQEHVLTNLCNGNEQWYHWLICWCANCVQNPGGERPGTAVVMIGDEGTGKGTFINHFGKIFGQHFMPIANTSRLVGNFNYHLKDIILLYADEAFWGGNVSEEGALKQIITEELIPIEPKGVDTYTVVNHIFLMMSTNNDWAVPAGLNARRFFVLKVNDRHAQDTEYFKPIQEEMKNGGLEAMMYDMMNMEIDVDLRIPPKTKALFLQKLQKMTYEEEFLYWILQEEDSEVVGAFISSSRLFEKFLDFVGSSHVRSHVTQPAFTRKIEPLTLNMAEKVREYVGGKRPWGFRFFNLKRCREEFEKIVGQDIEWNFKEEEDLADEG